MVHLDPFTAVRIQRGVEHLHRLGPHATAELLVELSSRIGGLPTVLTLLSEYQRNLTLAMARQHGGRDFVSRRPMLVPRRGP